MEDKKEIQKPFILEMEEAKMEIVQVINKAMQEHKLPCYIIDIIMSDIVAQIKDGAKSELEVAKKQVEEAAKAASPEA